MTSVEVRLYAELNDFVAPALQGQAVSRPFQPHQTVKDVLEAMGVPHTEIDVILVNGEPVGFSHRPSPGDRIAAYPVFETLDIAPIARLRAEPLRHTRFVLDVHLGRLARLLRLLGFEAAWANDYEDAALAEISGREGRILLTRDRGLLKRRAVSHGLFIRSDRPVEQAVEVVRRLHLVDRIRPFTRCLRCSAELVTVEKEDVLDRLEPLTRRYYEDFRRCPACGRVYWRGSHHARLEAVIAQIRAGVTPP